MGEHPYVVVIGAGMSGIHIGKHLRDMGIAFRIYEKAQEIGGTWRDNNYPGLYVDVPVSQYQYTFAPKYDWSRPYAPGPEIQRYLLDVTSEIGLREHIEFGTEITSTCWDGAAWELTTGKGEVIRADVVIAATGFLHRPILANVPGMDSFAGQSFHSSQWTPDIDVKGKRIGIVGSGSSGIQLVSALAYMDAEVTQFVRTPQWIETIDNPEASDSLLEQARTDPSAGPAVLAELEKGINQDPRLRDPRWKLANAGTKKEAATNALREALEVIEDPQLREALTPSFPAGCKRIPKSASYYRAVQEPNVRVVRQGVQRVEPQGVVTPDGELHELDIIVYATGYDAHAYMRPMNVVGAGGVRIDELWAEGPFSYRGVALPSFPNFFMLEGPFSPINNVAVPLSLDDQVGYIRRLLERIRSEKVAVAPTEEATDAFRQRLAAEADQTVWAHGCDNWYLDRRGTPIIWPWYDTEHKEMFADLAIEDLKISPTPAVQEAAAAT